MNFLKSIFKQAEPYQGVTYTYRILELKEKLFNSNAKPSEIYKFLEEIPVKSNYCIEFSMYFFGFNKKFFGVYDDFHNSNCKLTDHVEARNLTNLCKIQLTEEQNQEYHRLIAMAQ